jgi:broad specificity phosphatase PhoE
MSGGDPNAAAPPSGETDPRAAAALRTLHRVPAGAGAVVFIRHAERPSIPKGELGYEVPLTPAGALSARQLGGQLRGRLRRVYASPVRRCQLTAAELVTGAEQLLLPVVLPHLGEPGLFVQDGELAWPQFREYGVQTMAQKLSRSEPLPGFRSAAEGVAVLLRQPLTELPPAGQLDIHVTHDYILAITAWLLLGREADWPDFLDCVCVWRDDQTVGFSFRDEVGAVPAHLVG